MNYTFEPININIARIIDTWKYNGFMKNIYMDPYFESYENGDIILKGPNSCEGFAVYKDDELFGLFEYYLDDKLIEIGLAINPKYIGKGLGLDFLQEGLQFCVKNYNYKKDFIKLFVNKANLPAFKIYRKAGFKIYKEFDDEYEMRIKIKEINKGDK